MNAVIFSADFMFTRGFRDKMKEQGVRGQAGDAERGEGAHPPDDYEGERSIRGRELSIRGRRPSASFVLLRTALYCFVLLCTAL